MCYVANNTGLTDLNFNTKNECEKFLKEMSAKYHQKIPQKRKKDTTVSQSPLDARKLKNSIITTFILRAFNN